MNPQILPNTDFNIPFSITLILEVSSNCYTSTCIAHPCATAQQPQLSNRHIDT
ncbi:MAG TPA: hypothetical protein VFG10_08250 [Saprospiraceae bacterium]|nr:hypothetical protein [Saprospiraceae bacterium]